MRKSTNIFRDDREASIIGKKVAWFDKVIGYMMIVAFKMNSCSYEFVYEFCYDDECEFLIEVLKASNMYL